ncbi:MAG: PQQ-like beta-propeller repeat protein [Chitinispirillales bacterium]|jgi:outer membrane protein assembly factor BamB|nr:PQQ-like beta-propeller repeat protein [Chitinispirillales bacterium]
MDGEPLDRASAGAIGPASSIGNLFHVFADDCGGDGGDDTADSDDTFPQGKPCPPAPAHDIASWPRFRGTNINAISAEQIPLTNFSGGQPPNILWTIDLGEGHAAPAVHSGRVYVLDYDENEEADYLRVFSLETGQEIWRRGYNVKVRRNHGMSRTIPAVTDSAVVTIGPMCHVMAAHTQTGEFLWGIDLVKEYGSTVPLWYTGQCPLIDDTVVVIAPSGPRALMIGVHKMTGEILWETPNRHNWKMSHSSIIPMTFGGRKVYVYCASGGIAGVAADGPDRGAVLFESDEFNHPVVAPSPVQISNNRIFMTAGYGAGSAVFQVSHTDGADGRRFSITLVNRYGVREALASEQQTPLYHNGQLCAVLPKDAGPHRDRFVCVNENTPEKINWTSGQDILFGLGPFIIADNRFYILSDEGTLVTAAATPRRFEKQGAAKITHGVDAWGPMALVEGKLLLRDSRKMFCVDVTMGR